VGLAYGWWLLGLERRVERFLVGGMIVCFDGVFDVIDLFDTREGEEVFVGPLQRPTCPFQQFQRIDESYHDYACRFNYL
jgi:hypothetical protein